MNGDLKFGLQICPVCLRTHDMPPFRRKKEGFYFRCDTCGRFTISFEASEELKQLPCDDIRRKKLSEYIQNNQNDDNLFITKEILKHIQET